MSFSQRSLVSDVPLFVLAKLGLPLAMPPTTELRRGIVKIRSALVIICVAGNSDSNRSVTTWEGGEASTIRTGNPARRADSTISR